MFALPAGPLVRWRGWVIAAWAALALLFAPRASHVQQVLALRGGASETTESARASDLLKQAFPSPFADYVAIVVHGPVRWTNQRFEVVLDTLKAATERRPYVSQVISVRSIGEIQLCQQGPAHHIPDRRADAGIHERHQQERHPRPAGQDPGRPGAGARLRRFR